MELKEYISYFFDKNGKVKNPCELVSPCCYCPDDQFDVCACSGRECEKYINYVNLPIEPQPRGKKRAKRQ